MRAALLSLALALAAGRAEATSNICAWATFDPPTADSPTVPSAAWTTSPPCISTAALYRVAVLDITNGGGPATNTQVVIHLDSVTESGLGYRLTLIDAYLTGATGTVQWAEAPEEPVVCAIPLMTSGQVARVTLRARATAWKPHGATPQNDWAWGDGAWPACEHLGGREIIPGVLYKQIWARDLYWALEERCQAVHSNGSAHVWLGRPSWWTEAGVTNRVVRYDGASQDGADTQAPSVTVLEAAKILTALLAPHYMNTELVDPESFEDSWPAFHRSCGGMIDYTVTNYNLSAWVWDCPSEPHSASWDVEDQREIGTNTYLFTAQSLPAALALPERLFNITPYRFLEGFCTPSAGGEAWRFRDSTATQVCAWASAGAVSVGAGGECSAEWDPELECINQGADISTASLVISNTTGVAATNVAVEITVDAELEVVDASCPAPNAWVQWAGAPAAPVVVRFPLLGAGQTTSVQLRARLRRDQGDQTAYYWGQFGWDAVRDSIRALDTMHVGLPGWGLAENPTAPVYPAWYWPEDDGDNVSNAFGTDDRTYYFTGTAPGSVVDAGDWDGAKDAAGLAESTTRLESHPPSYRYFGLFSANRTPAPGTTNYYSCSWQAIFTGVKNVPVIRVRRQWPPTNVVMEATFFADTYEGAEAQADYPTVPQRDTETIGTHTFSTPTTNDHTFAVTLGQNALDSGFWPSDPSSGPDWPALRDSIYEAGTPEFLADRHPNFTLTAKSWENAHLLLRFTWSLP